MSELPEDLVHAVGGLKSVTMDHIQNGKRIIETAMRLIGEMEQSITTLDSKLKDKNFVPTGDVTFVGAMQNFQEVIEGADVSKGSKDALQDMWFRVARELLTKEELASLADE